MIRFILQRCALTVVAVLSAAATLAAIRWAEHEFAPVVTGWSVTGIAYENGAVVMQGELVKNRPCRLIQTDVRLVHRDGRSVLIYQFKPEDDALGINITTGAVTWGPVKFPAPKKLVQTIHPDDVFEVSALHQCHALWPQLTHYGSISAAVVLQNIHGGS